MSDDVVLLASYPRSGNSLLRSVLKGAFGLWSSSVYVTETYSQEIAERLGHVDHADADIMTDLNDGLCLFKTHEYPTSTTRAIYMVRDGREASVSYAKFSGTFSKQEYTLDDVIAGRCRYNSWSDHLRAWMPDLRPNTLLLRYADMRQDLGGTVEAIATFLHRDPVGGDVPAFDQMRQLSSDFFRSGTNATWRDVMTDEQHEQFWNMHGRCMERFGYTKDACVTAGAGEIQYV